MVGQRAELVDESLEDGSPALQTRDDFFYRYQRGRPVLNVKTAEERIRRELKRDDLPIDQSVLSQRKDPDQYPEITYLGHEYAKVGSTENGTSAPTRGPAGLRGPTCPPISCRRMHRISHWFSTIWSISPACDGASSIS